MVDCPKCYNEAKLIGINKDKGCLIISLYVCDYCGNNFTKKDLECV